MMVTAELVLRWADGSMDLMGRNSSSGGEYQVATLADGTNWGNPESVRRVLRTALLDGSRSAKDRDGNRTIPLKLQVTAADGGSLAAGERELDLIDGKRCELVWTPPGLLGVSASVFVVDYADLAHEMNDLAENRWERYYTLTLSALPHAYSDTWIEVPALVTSASTRTEFDSCDTPTGWTASNATLSDGGDYIRVTFNSLGQAVATRPGAVNFSTDRYLSAVLGSGSGRLVGVEVLVGSAWVNVVRVAIEGRTQIYDVGTAVTGIRFIYESTSVTPPGAVAGDIYSLGRQATVRSAASNGQVRTIAVPGSRRTPATVQVVAPDQLGDVIVYSGPDYDPSLTSRLQAGRATQVTNADPLSVYTWPASEIPKGHYAVWSSVTSALSGGAGTTATLKFRASLFRAGNQVGTEVLSEVIIPHGLANDVRPLFSTDLPVWDVDDASTLQFAFLVELASGSGTVAFPWLWLFNMSEGDLFMVHAGSERALRILPPSLDRENPAVTLGFEGSDVPVSLASQMPAWGGAPSVTPPFSTLYTWSSYPTPINSASARFRPASHTHTES